MLALAILNEPPGSMGTIVQHNTCMSDIQIAANV
jgi:hypothetical protein